MPGVGNAVSASGSGVAGTASEYTDATEFTVTFIVVVCVLVLPTVTTAVPHAAGVSVNEFPEPEIETMSEGDAETEKVPE